MIKKLKIGKVNILFVFRHRWDEGELRILTSFIKWELGLWFKKTHMVGKAGFEDPDNWKNNLVNNYMIGCELLICKFWFEIRCGETKSFNI